MLGWLEYNVKRALGIEISDQEEIVMGEEQVKGTIRELYSYEKNVSQKMRGDRLWIVQNLMIMRSVFVMTG